jgi:NitT/TauT family transport system permease protein
MPLPNRGPGSDASALEREQALCALEADRAAAQDRSEKRRVWLLQAALLSVVLLAWWLLSGTVIDRLFFSDPVSVVRALFHIVVNGLLWWHLEQTLIEMTLGYALGIGAGIAAGFIVSVLPWGEPIARPLMLAAYATPKIALAPLIIIWLGIGLTPKIVLAASLVFFIVYFNTLSGIAAVSPGMLATVRVMSASGIWLFAKITLPSAAPYVFVAARITLPAALIGAIIGEFMSSNRGIGYLIAAASSRYDTAQVFAGILSLLAFVLLLNGAVSALERYALRWRPAAPASAT